MGGPESFQAIKTHFDQSPEQVAAALLGRTRWGGGELRRGRDGVAERKTHPERKKQVAIVIIGIILPAFTITSGSQAHFSLSQTWEVSSTTSSILQTFQNINLMLENVKGLLRVIDKLGGRSDRI